jgi:hypothetical protein
MDAFGKLGHVGIAKEVEFGTAVAATDFLKFTSESLSLKIDELIDASQNGLQDEPDSLEGMGTIAGNTVHEAHPVGLGYLLRAWFSQPATTAQVSFTVSATNKYFDFNIGAAELVATLATGTFVAGATQDDVGSLCDTIYNAVTAAEAIGVYTVSYSTVTNKFTITRSTGTFEILWKTGTHGSDNLDTHCGTLLGYTDSANDTGGLTYTSDSAVPVVYQHIYTPVSHIVPAARKGTATAGGATSLTDSAQSAVWTTNCWAGWWLHVVEGTSAGTYRIITSNTTTALTVATMTAPSTDSVYEIIPGPENCILPPYTLEVNRNIAGSAAAFQYTGLVANTLAFAVGVGTKILQVTAGWLGKDCTNIAPTTVTLPTTEPFKWSQVKIGIGLNTSGTATGGTISTLVNSGAAFTADALIGKLVMKTNSAGTKSEVRPITDNDATSVTVSPSFVDVAIATDTYKIYDCPDTVESLEFTLDNGVVALPTLNYTKRVNRMVADSFRTGSMTMTVIPQNKTDYATYYASWATKEILVWFKGQIIAGNNYYDLFFRFPKVLITAYPVNVGGPGRITVAIAAKTKYDSTAGYMVKSWLNNNKASYSA